MQPDSRFQKLDKSFWAHVRVISQKLGYTNRRTQQIRVHNVDNIIKAMHELNLQADHLEEDTPFIDSLYAYFEYRAAILNGYVEPRLMDAERAQATFEDLRHSLRSTLPIPMNKQSGEKKRPAYFTGMVNMLIEAHLNGLSCDYEPRRLPVIVRNSVPCERCHVR
jgi:hypothetical protein